MSLATLRNVGIVVMLALIVAFVPQGGDTADFVIQVITVTFMILVVLFGIRLYRMFRSDVYGLGERHRALFYASIGVAILAMAARPRLFETGAGIVGWVVLIAGASVGLYSVWRRYREYKL